MKNRKKNRMPGYDYSLPGYYFVTMIAHGRVPVFGKIRNGVMNLNEYGEIAERQWSWLHEQYEYIMPDEYVIMPDHVHGIVVIHDTPRDIPGHGAGPLHIRKDNSRVVPTCDKSAVCDISIANGMSRVVPTCDKSAAGDTSGVYDRRHSLLSKTMNAYKTTTSKHIHLAGNVEFRWQRSFHDHIIRDQDELNAIRRYIRQNPLRFTGAISS